MRFFASPDVNFFVDVPPGWNRYCRYPITKGWYVRPSQKKHYINYYLDLEGSRMPRIEDKDLYFENWPKSRLIKKACLPLLYIGARFIKLEQGPPGGFTCAPFPMNLIEARNMSKQIRAEEKAAQEAKAAAKKAQKLAAMKAKQAAPKR